MMIASTMASYSMAEADLLRRIMSKKKEEAMNDEKDKFISKAIENGYSKEVSSKVFDLIHKFSSVSSSVLLLLLLQLLFSSSSFFSILVNNISSFL